jgi:thioredoxin-dependent peroxiredoxin
LRRIAMTIKEGKPAPAFTLQDAEGKKVSLADFAGKNLILYFYPKDDTPGCTKEACGFRDDWRQIQKSDAVVVGVSADSPESHQKFRAKYKLPFPLLSDPDRGVMKTYGAYGEKMMYGKKTVGVIRSTVWIGPDGKVRKHWARVANAAEHPAKVLEALREGA